MLRKISLLCSDSVEKLIIILSCDAGFEPKWLKELLCFVCFQL